MTLEQNIIKMTQPGRISFTTVGDWDGAIRAIGREGTIVRRALYRAEFRFAKKISQLVKGHIKKQDIDWIPLSYEYQARKKELGYPEDFYRLSDTYLDAITVWRSGNRT